MSLDFPGVGGRRTNLWDRFLLFVEQLEQAIGLLESGRLARQRMALVALDTLAEGLLFGHIETVFLASDEPTWVQHRTFPARERRAARERFNKRVAIAAEKPESVSPVYFPERILDEHDAAVFRVAHHYRNPVYHEDRHNPALIHPLGRLYAQAVGRAFVRSHRRGYAVLSSPGFMEEIARLGWEGRQDGYFPPREAAQAIVARRCDPLMVDGAPLRAELADDIGCRCDAVDEDIEGLRRDAWGPDIDQFLVRVQDWASNRGDGELLRLKAEHQALEERAGATGNLDPATLEAMRMLEHKQWAHLFGQDRDIVVRVDPQSHVRIRKKGERLRSWRAAETGLLEAYQRLDDELELLEAALDFMMWETDRRAWAEEDLARGR